MTEGLFKKTIPGIEELTGDVETPKVILVSGKKGTLKTTFSIVLAAEYCKNHPKSTGIYITLEQSAKELRKDLKAKDIAIPKNLKLIDLSLQRLHPAIREREAKKTAKRIRRAILKEINIEKISGEESKKLENEIKIRQNIRINETRS